MKYQRKAAVMSYVKDAHHASTPSVAKAGAIGKIATEPIGGTLSARDLFENETLRNFANIIFCSIVFSIIILSFRPFSAATSVQNIETGDPLNQIGFLTLFGLMSILLLTQVSQRQLRYFATPMIVLFLASAAISIFNSPASYDAARALALAFISAFLAFSLLLLPRSERSLRTILINTSITILVVAYGGILLVPDLAKHGYSSLEAQHFGLWRGPFAHKNNAGPAFSVIAIFGIYIARSGQGILGALITAAAFLFVINTGSKTTSGFLPIAIAIVLFAHLFSSARLAVFLGLLAIIAIGFLTVGSIYFEPLAHATALVIEDGTFTGRASLWLFGLDHISYRPWFGFGFDNFWGSDFLDSMPLPSYVAWDVRNMVHGHNNYIDLLLAFGLIGSIPIFLFLFVLPFLNYIHAYQDKSQRRLADLFFMIIIFMCLLSFMETFILWRADPIWIFHIFSVLGLHFLAKTNCRSKRASAHCREAGTNLNM